MNTYYGPGIPRKAYFLGEARQPGGTGREPWGMPWGGPLPTSLGEQDGGMAVPAKPVSSCRVLTPGMSRTAASLHSNVNILNTAELYLKGKKNPKTEI